MEVTVIGKEHNQPLKDTDTVKVYHGTGSVDFAITAVKRGFLMILIVMHVIKH